MKAPLKREDLDTKECMDPKCAHRDHRFVVSGQCHPGAPTWASYEGEGVLRFDCAICRKLIVEIEVAA